MLRWADPGGEYYFSLGMTNAIAAGLWTTTNGGSLVNNAAAGRATQYAVSCPSGAGNNRRDVAANMQSGWVGGAAYVSQVGGSNNILAFLDGGSIQMALALANNNVIYFNRNGTNVGAVSSNLLTPGWHYFEAFCTVNSTTGGSVQAWVDGVQWINTTGINTQATGNPYFNGIGFYAASFNTSGFWKDMYILDTASGVYTTRLGDLTVNVEWPNAVGVNQQFTNFGGANAVASVQDGITHTGTWPDGDTTYIASNVVGQISDFAHQSAASAANVFGVIHTAYLRKDDAGSRTANLTCISNGASEMSTPYGLSNSYLYYADVIEKDPNTNAVWTISGFNSATFGVVVAS